MTFCDNLQDFNLNNIKKKGWQKNKMKRNIGEVIYYQKKKKEDI